MDMDDPYYSASNYGMWNILASYDLSEKLLVVTLNAIWTAAARLGQADKFKTTATAAIDDHIPFAQQGVPVVDIIDLDYPYWHTPEDTLDKLSAENMRVVADVVLNALPDIGAKLSR